MAVMLSVRTLRLALQDYHENALVLVAVFLGNEALVYEAEEDIANNTGHPQLSIILRPLPLPAPGGNGESPGD
jgi:predicted membrane-bound mannosyltransferase